MVFIRVSLTVSYLIKILVYFKWHGSVGEHEVDHLVDCV